MLYRWTTQPTAMVCYECINSNIHMDGPSSMRRKIENCVIVVMMDKKYDKYDDECHFLPLEKN